MSYNVLITDPQEGINTVTANFCPGDSVAYEGTFYSSPGHHFFLINPDSAVILNITESATYDVAVDTHFCQGTPVLINGTWYASQGATAKDTLQSAFGCDSIVTYTLKYDTNAYEEEICIVTIDTETGKNMVVWERTPNQKTTGYTVYKESNVSDTYDSLAWYPFDSLSVYVDMQSKPEQQQYLYKLTTKDECGNQTNVQTVSYHKTLFLQYVSAVGGVNLNWQKYEIDGSLINFESYIIYRGSDSTALTPIDTVSGSINAYTDTDPSALSGRQYYRIGGVKDPHCAPSSFFKASTGPFSQSISNIEDNRLREEDYVPALTGSITNLKTYPNPFRQVLHIEYTINSPGQVLLALYNMYGKQVSIIDTGIKEAGTYTLTHKIEIPGVYLLRLHKDEDVATKKVVGL